MDPFHPTYEMRVASQPIKTAGVGGICPEIRGKGVFALKLEGNYFIILLSF